MNYSITILFAIFSMMTLAHAESPTNLESRAEREDLWTKTAIQFPEVVEPTAVLRTETGKLRLLELSPSYAVKAEVYGKQGNFRRLQSKEELTKACRDLASVVDLEIPEGHSFWLKFLANPIHQQAWKKMGLENKLEGMQIEASLSYRNSTEALVSSARLKKLEDGLNKYLTSESQSISQSGYVNIHWPGIDDLVCDLIAGKIDLKIRLIARFEAAELRRQKVFTEAQVQQVFQRLKSMPIAEQSMISRLTSRSANLGILLQQELGNSYEDFVTRKFHRLTGQMINTTDGSLMPSDLVTAQRISKSLDDLSEGMDTNQSIVNINFDWNFEGGEL